MSEQAIPEQLVRYLAARDKERAENVRLTWEKLSPREQRLVREAAVMGWVQGVRSIPGSYKAEIPRDNEIVSRVLEGCFVFDRRHP